MSTANPFDLLVDDDAEDPSLLIAAHQKTEPKKAAAPPSNPAVGRSKAAAQDKIPSKAIPDPAQVKEAKSDSARGGRGYGRGRGAGGGSYRDSRDSAPNENSYGNRELSAPKGASEADAGKTFERRGGYGGPREPSRGGGRRGGFSNGDFRGDRERPPRRQFDRHSGTGHGNEMKRQGSGQGNWGTDNDELAPEAEGTVVEVEKVLDAEKPSVEEYVQTEEEKEAAKKEAEEREREAKEMTLEEYEKVLEEKRKSLQSLKAEGRKVDAKEFESMQALSNKKSNDDIFIKLGSEKDKKKDLTEKDDRVRKSVSINEFLKPAEGERYSGGRGRGRGRGFRGGNETRNVSAPSIEDPSQFPTLGAK